MGIETQIQRKKNKKEFIHPLGLFQSNGYVLNLKLDVIHAFEA